jgi:hypothetical protein
MNHEERIAWAKRKAAETAPERARQRERDEAERSERIASMGSEEANRAAHDLSSNTSIPWMGPVATPAEWTQAVAAARAVTIEAARHQRTITFGELRVAAYEATNMKVGHNSYAELAMSINDKADSCLLSSIIVRADTGKPGAGFLPFARRSGFDAPVTTLQRQAYDHFSDDS